LKCHTPGGVSTILSFLAMENFSDDFLSDDTLASIQLSPPTHRNSDAPPPPPLFPVEIDDDHIVIEDSSQDLINKPVVSSPMTSPRIKSSVSLLRPEKRKHYESISLSTPEVLATSSPSSLSQTPRDQTKHALATFVPQADSPLASHNTVLSGLTTPRNASAGAPSLMVQKPTPRRENSSAASSSNDSSNSYMCPLCGANLNAYTETRRAQHVHRYHLKFPEFLVLHSTQFVGFSCCENDSSNRPTETPSIDSVVQGENLPKTPTSLLYGRHYTCVLCGKDISTRKKAGRISHLKKCSKSKGITPRNFDQALPSAPAQPPPQDQTSTLSAANQTPTRPQSTDVVTSTYFPNTSTTTTAQSPTSTTSPRISIGRSNSAGSIQKEPPSVGWRSRVLEATPSRGRGGRPRQPRRQRRTSQDDDELGSDMELAKALSLSEMVLYHLLLSILVELCLFFGEQQIYQASPLKDLAGFSVISDSSPSQQVPTPYC